jgi:plastocyanin
MSVLNSSVRWIVAAVVATVAICLSAAVMAAGESRVVIEIREFEFIPEQPTVSPGDIVVWKNLDIVPHTATSEDDSWDSDLIEAGGTWETVIREDMVLAYYCRFHPSMIADLSFEAE